MSDIIELGQADAGVCGNPVEVGSDSCHNGWVATFTTSRAVADNADDGQSIVDVQMHAAATVAIAC